MKQYDSEIKKWWSYCLTLKRSPYEADTSLVLEFLVSRFGAGAAYGTLNSARSAIVLMVGDSISSDTNISRFFKGVFKKRPSKSKYDSTWDVQIVFDEMIKMHPLNDLNLKELTEKTVMLLALGSAQRVQTLSLIKIENIKETSGGFEIKIPDLIKTSRAGSTQPLIKLPFLNEEPKCCVARALQRYLQVTEPLRGLTKELFITIKKPYKAAGKQTISRWIRCSLLKCGVDENFTAHSTRHASTSAAAKKGATVGIINSAACWSKNSQMFAKVYNRPIVDMNKSFCSIVFSKP